jgi:predicted regulator of amino acid metabolism with ACT domain
MIAKVAQVIGENGINIGSMNVVQKNDKHETESIMVINIDTVVDEKTLELISKIDGVNNPKCVNLTV